MSKNCKTCGEKLEEQRLQISGEDLGWRVKADSYPVLACPRGHDRRELYPDFNTSWSEELVAAPGLWVKEPWFLRKKWRCSSCGESQELALTAQAARRETLHREKPSAFVIEVAGPMLVCRYCQQAHIGMSDAGEVMDACANALEKQAIERH
jgi:hypothetical protein